MRGFILGVVAISMAACLPAAEPRLTVRPDDRLPLEARLFPPHMGQVALRLSQPAYVAVFEVVPGAGVSLVHPRSGTGFTAVSESWIPLHYNSQRWGYQTYAASYRNHASSRGSSYSPFGGAMQLLEPPRYLFLIASLEPIDIEQFQGSGTALRRHLGLRYASYQPYDVMEELAYAVLPFTADGRWVSDVIADWGSSNAWGSGYFAGTSAAMTSFVPIVCNDGSLRYAPYQPGWGIMSLPCQPAAMGPQGPMPPPGTPQAPQSPVPADSAGEGREREVAPGEGRRRAALVDAVHIDASSGAPELTDEQRVRIRQLQEDARRDRFGADMDRRLRQNVAQRQRSDLMAQLRAANSRTWAEQRGVREESPERRGARGARGDGSDAREVTRPASPRSRGSDPSTSTPPRASESPSSGRGAEGGRSRGSEAPASQPAPSSAPAPSSEPSSGRSRVPPSDV